MVLTFVLSQCFIVKLLTKPILLIPIVITLIFSAPLEINLIGGQIITLKFFSLFESFSCLARATQTISN